MHDDGTRKKRGAIVNVRRLAGAVLALASLLPTFNVGVPAYAIPFNPPDRVFYQDGHGDSCSERLGWPIMAGSYGACGGYLADHALPPDDPEELRHAYQAAGESVWADGPDQYAGETWRALGMPTTPELVPAVRTIGIFGWRVAQRPAGADLWIGIVAPWTLLGGLLLAFWRRRPSLAGSPVTAGPREAAAGERGSARL